MGDIIQLAELEMIVQSDVKAERLSNIKITLTDDNQQEITTELYGKVVEEINELDHPAFRVNLTSIPPEASKFLKNLS